MKHTINIQSNKDYYMIKTSDIEISVFDVNEWSEIECMLKTFNDNYNYYRHMSDNEISRHLSIDREKFNMYIEASNYFNNNDYDYIHIEANLCTGEEFLNTVYSEASYYTYIYVNHFRKWICRNYDEICKYYNFLKEYKL